MKTGYSKWVRGKNLNLAPPTWGSVQTSPYRAPFLQQLFFGNIL